MAIKDYKGCVAQSLEKGKELQAKLNAVVSFAEDELTNDNTGLFSGVPIAVKDNFSTKNLRTTASSRILDNFMPVYDATVITKLKEAGAVVAMKASMDELGMGGTNLNAHTGPVHNPWDVSRIAGGSSGGSAVLVASGVVPFALGTDTGDSVRKPAAYTGVVGVKPSYGRISRFGVIPYASSLDHVGYFTQNVKDAADALSVLAGRDDHDMTSSNKEVEAYGENLQSSLQGKKIAVLKNVLDEMKDVEAKEAFNSVIENLKKQGAKVEEVSMNATLVKATAPVYYIIANAEGSANHSNLDGVRFGVREDGETMEDIMMNSRTKGLSIGVRKRFVIGSYALFTENQEHIFRKAQRIRRLLVDEYRAILSSYDALLSPAAPSIAPTIEEVMVQKTNGSIAENHMMLGNFSGCPSMTIPMGLVREMPVGINITCDAFCEQEMFNVAKGIEDICNFTHKPKEGNA